MNKLISILSLLVLMSCHVTPEDLPAIHIDESPLGDFITNFVANDTTIYYSGLPIYSDEVLNEVGVLYGVQWQNTGCVDNEYSSHNEEVMEMLDERNGEDWQDKFWEEVEVTHRLRDVPMNNKEEGKSCYDRAPL